MFKRALAITAFSIAGVLVFAGVVSAQSSIFCSLLNGSNFTFSTSCNPSPAQPVSNRYIALGDSVAAGLGLSGNYPNDDARCGRTTQGYPNYVATSLHMSLTNVACSSATAGDLVTKQSVSGPNIPAQLTTAFAAGTPKLITITAGANDAHWANFIKSCYAYDCSSSSSTFIARSYLSLLSVKLTYAMASLQARAGGSPPKVIVTGYYNPISSTCSGKLPNITNAELSWITNETAALNQTIQQAIAGYSFVKFVPISFAGHDICSAQPWVQGLNDLAPFHPTALGQQSIAADVVAAAK